MPSYRHISSSLLAAAVLAWASPAGAAEPPYPARPVRIVVPYAPGGGSDATARLLGQKLGERLGQTFVIDNRPGAASMIGTEIVARAAGDGYTLILADVPLTINPVITLKPTYDPTRDFAPVMLFGTTPQIMVAHPSFGAASVKDLLAMPRAQTEKLGMGTGGTASSPHMTYELLRLRSGLTLNHIPYKGGGPATADVLAGQIPLAFNAAPSSMVHLRAGRLKGLGITSAQRHPLVPTIMTFVEAGVPDFVTVHWYGVLASGGTPAHVVAKLHDEIARALDSPDLKERFDALAIDIARQGPQAFRAAIDADLKRWKEVVERSGIKFN